RIIRPKIIKPVIIRAIIRVTPKRIGPRPKPSLITQYFRTAQRFMNLDRMLFSNSFAYCQNSLRQLLATFPQPNCTTPHPDGPAAATENSSQLSVLHQLIKMTSVEATS
ncbi:MAG: hypothetical protein WCO56_19790, partial [Verrucomicrobiota bacterium]